MLRNLSGPSVDSVSIAAAVRLVRESAGSITTTGSEIHVRLSIAVNDDVLNAKSALNCTYVDSLKELWSLRIVRKMCKIT